MKGGLNRKKIAMKIFKILTKKKKQTEIKSDFYKLKKGVNNIL